MKILLSLGLIILIASLTFSLDFIEKREFDRSWTSAICEGNKCRDYEIKCLGNEVISISPITGFVIFPENWEDPRERKELC